MKREEIIEAIAKSLRDKPVCRCYTGKSRWEEDAEIAYNTAFPLIRDMVWEEALGVVDVVVQEKKRKRDEYGDILHSEVVGANDALDALEKVYMERDLND